MREYLPILIVGAIIGVFATVFLVVYLLDLRRKDNDDGERHMRDGEIVEQGRHEELLQNKGFYAELWNSQFETV